jgi:hypothetical protein
MTVLYTGRCLCGAVQYECGPLQGPPTLCHCESCRRASGAHALGWITVAAANLRYAAGRPLEYQSSPGRHRAFCGRCGSPLTYRSELRAGEVDVTIGSLDEPGRAAPADHIWMEDAPGWDRPADGLPRHARGRGA